MGDSQSSKLRALQWQLSLEKRKKEWTHERTGSQGSGLLEPARRLVARARAAEEVQDATPRLGAASLAARRVLQGPRR